MPKISESRREERRRQIVDAAVRCFRRDGFHASSMETIIAESGMSAGAVYRYFPSKDALIMSVASAVTGRLTEIVADEARAGLPPRQAIPRLLERIDDLTGQPTLQSAGLVILGWGEALRRPDMRELAERVIGLACPALAGLIRTWREEGHISPAIDPETAARALLGVIQGYVVQRALLPSLEASTYAESALSLMGVAQRTMSRGSLGDAGTRPGG